MEAKLRSDHVRSIFAEHARLLERREAARAAFVAADAEAIALTNAIRDQAGVGLPGSSISLPMEWLRAGERASAALFAGLLPMVDQRVVNESTARWTSYLTNLIKG